MLKQTDQYIDKNIVRIMDKEGTSVGTGFFINSKIGKKKYCVTCHHNICDLAELYVGKHKGEMFHATWFKENSDVFQDIAILIVRDAPYQPLVCGFSVYPRLAVTVLGFPRDGRLGNLSCDKREGVLGEMQESFMLKGGNAKGNREHNLKPDVIINGYSIETQDNGATSLNQKWFQRGLSGGPVCYKYGLAVLGMFVAEQDNTKGYMIPITDVLDRFKITYDTKKIVEKGNNLFANQHYQDAFVEYNKVLDDPSYSKVFRVWFNSGDALRIMEEYEEALKCFQKATEIKPNDFMSWLNEGHVLLFLKKFEEAVKCYDKAIDIDSNNLYAWGNKGWALNQLQMFEDAIKSFDKAIEIDPNNWDAWSNKGFALINLQKFEEAIKSYDKAIGIDSSKWADWSNKGWALVNLQKWEDAIKCYDISIGMNTNNAWSWINKGWAFYNLKKLEEAIKCYDRAIDIDSNNGDAWNYKGWALSGLGLKKEADECFAKAKILSK